MKNDEGEKRQESRWRENVISAVIGGAVTLWGGYYLIIPTAKTQAEYSMRVAYQLQKNQLYEEIVVGCP